MKADIVDGYCHCGLHKYRPIKHVSQFMDYMGISRAVLVQHLGEYDNSYIETIVTNQPDRYAGVFMVDMNDSDSCGTISRWTRTGVFRGVRFVARTLQSQPKVWEHAANMGLCIVTYDEPTIAAYTHDLAIFARKHEQTKLVISHLGMLDNNVAPHFNSNRHILPLADHPNIYIQLSGFHMFAQSPYAELIPVVEQLIEAFGTKRTFWGTNYPVPQDDTVLKEELELIRTGRLGIPGDILKPVLYDTALDLWFNQRAEQTMKDKR